MAKSKIKLPKRVAGVKIPRAVRKGPVVDFVNSTAGRVLIAQALTAAIGVLAYKSASPETREGVRGKAKKGVDAARETLERNTARLSFAFGEAVTAFRTALGEPAPSRDSNSAADALAAQLEQVSDRGGKKKRRAISSPSEPSPPH